MQNIVTIRGEPHHVLVIPDGDATVVNVGGDHSVRGGTLAQKLYNPTPPPGTGCSTLGCASATA